MMVSAALSMTIGTLFFITGGAKWLEKKFETHIESYESILEKKTRIWSQPELGTLSGEIVKIQNNTLLLKDWTNKVWEKMCIRDRLYFAVLPFRIQATGL